MSEENKSGTPDLSRIINLIMENPKLIEEISALAKSDGEESEKLEQTEIATATDASDGTYSEKKRDGARTRRAQLMSALKPYLSGERQKAIDSMMTFADVLDTMRGR